MLVLPEGLQNVLNINITPTNEDNLRKRRSIQTDQWYVWEEDEPLAIQKRTKRQAVETQVPINNQTDIVQFYVIVRFDGVTAKYSEDNNKFVNVFIDPEFERLEELAYHRPFWPFNTGTVDVLVSEIYISFFLSFLMGRPRDKLCQIFQMLNSPERMQI